MSRKFTVTNKKLWNQYKNDYKESIYRILILKNASSIAKALEFQITDVYKSNSLFSVPDNQIEYIITNITKYYKNSKELESDSINVLQDVWKYGYELKEWYIKHLDLGNTNE